MDPGALSSPLGYGPAARGVQVPGAVEGTALSIYPPVREELARLLSQPRLHEYRLAAGGKLDGALRLYAWNLAVSAAFYESMHYLEVALRNTMDEALTRWAGTELAAADPWYRDPAVPLNPNSRKIVAAAVHRATNDGQRPELPGRVVAELGLGFWWFLLAGGYGRPLWRPCLRHAFPTARRERLHTSVDHVRMLRNRVAHHEPIHTRDLAEDYRRILDTAERVSPRLAWWIDTTSRVPAVLDQRP